LSPRPTPLDERLYDYVLNVGVPEHPAQLALRAETDALPDGSMRSAPEQVRLLAWLVELIGARRVLEIGCFTGYGTLGLALALPADGRVVTLDVNDHWAAIGRRHWRQAGVEERIDLRVGLALDGLDMLLREGGAGSFDLAYIDADKKSYDTYYERVLALLRPGGIVALDNVLWHGAVADPDDGKHQTATLRALNTKIRHDPRVSMLLLPVGDGLTLARRL
jgi:predicted O-methyltransferase YrrM